MERSPPVKPFTERFLFSRKACDNEVISLVLEEDARCALYKAASARTNKEGKVKVNKASEKNVAENCPFSDT